MPHSLITRCLVVIMLSVSIVFVDAQSISDQPDSSDRQCRLFPVQINSKFGYIDGTGKIIIEPRFQTAVEFTGGLARVGKNNQTGFIDTAGNLILPFKYYTAGEFSEGLADVGWDDRAGYIDKTGKIIIDFPDSQKWHFSEGLAAVTGKDNHGMEKWGFIDKSGKWIIQPKFDNAYIFSEELAAVKLKNKVQYIDKTGRTIFSGFIAGTEFSEGLAAVRVSQFFGLKKRWGFIDKTGKLKIPPKFTEAGRFSEGLASVNFGSESNPQWGYIDKTGKAIIPPQFKNALDFSEALAGVEINNGKWGFIDKTGAVINSASYDYISDRFCGGLAGVGIEDRDKHIRRGYINAKGIYVWQPSK